jgi:hypothetical protein
MMGQMPEQHVSAVAYGKKKRARRGKGQRRQLDRASLVGRDPVSDVLETYCTSMGLEARFPPRASLHQQY